jgi:S1-C subfamily serine protease
VFEMRKGSLAVLFLVLFTFCGLVYANQEPEEILRAVVKIRAIIPENARTAEALGTEREGHGVVIDSDGHVLTIGYLILEAETIEITGPDGEVVDATFVGYDHNSGFGLLRVNTSLNVQPLKLGRSSEVKVGDPVLIVGHGGLDTAQGAYVVARQEFAGYWEYLLDDAIFTTPPYSDFGGAALIGPDGQLLGIGSLFNQVTIPELGTVASNMFVPIDYLKPILAELIAQGHTSDPPRPWLGLNVRETHGRVFIVRVSSESPAEQAGLQPDDIILAVNKQEVKGVADFYRKVWALGEAGVDIPLSILQGTQIRDIIVHSADRQQFFKISQETEALLAL